MSKALALSAVAFTLLTIAGCTSTPETTPDTATVAEIPSSAKQAVTEENPEELSPYKKFQSLLQAADLGDPEALYAVGLAYKKGDMAIQDEKLSQKYFLAAADRGNAPAQYEVATSYLYGTPYINQNYDLALIYFDKAAQQGHAEARYSLGNCYYNGWGTEIDKEKAAECFCEAAKLNHAKALNALGDCYIMGDGLSQDYEAAAKCYAAAAKQGIPEAYTSLGGMFFYGLGMDKDYESAYKCFKTACDMDCATGYLYMGYLCSAKGEHEKALYWYQKAAGKDDADAQYALGCVYESGSGIKQNLFSALNYYALAAEKGNVSASLALGRFYTLGIATQKEPVKAKVYLEKALSSSKLNEKEREEAQSLLNSLKQD